MAHLHIGGSSSTCGNCGMGASPREHGHYHRLGYSVEPGTPGCGEPWTSASLTSYLAGQNIAEVIDNIWFDDFIKNLLRNHHLKTTDKKGIQ